MLNNMYMVRVKYLHAFVTQYKSGPRVPFCDTFGFKIKRPSRSFRQRELKLQTHIEREKDREREIMCEIERQTERQPERENEGETERERQRATTLCHQSTYS